MAKIVKGKYCYSEHPKGSKEWDKVLEAEKEIKVRQFAEGEGKNVIHGSNIKAYQDDFPSWFCDELKARKKHMKSMVLQYANDDSGNLDYFIKVYGNYVKYNCDEQSFYIWNGRFWMKDMKNIVPLWCLTIMKARRNYTFELLQENSSIKNYNSLIKHAKSCCNQTSIRAMIEGLKCTLSCNSSIFDNHKHLLNVLNGTIDLETGNLKRHDYTNFITKLIPVEYDAKAESVTFTKFLKEIFNDKDLINYVNRLLGYCITGETKEQVAHFCIGNGANGKSTLLSAMRYVMSDYAAVIPAKVLTATERLGTASSEIAQLPHKRLVCCSELNCTDVLNEGKIKIMSSGETISARQLYNTSFTFEPEFKFIIDTNYLPIINGTDHGIWRRIRVIPFENTIPKDKLNKNLLNDLKKDRKAILNWLVKGAIKYYSDGLGSCEEVEKATKKYRKSQDTLGSFIDACIRNENGSEVRARALYEAYTCYCDDNFLSPMSETKFGKDFATRGYKKAKDKISRKYLDIALRS